MNNERKPIGRDRGPRVHITYDVQAYDRTEKRELPFVVAVLADLSGTPERPLPEIEDREFHEIERDNVSEVMQDIHPRLDFSVPNRLHSNDCHLDLHLQFGSINDFEPQNVAQQIPELRKLLEVRDALIKLRTSLMGNDKLEDIVREIVNKDLFRQANAQTSAEEEKER